MNGKRIDKPSSNHTQAQSQAFMSYLRRLLTKTPVLQFSVPYAVRVEWPAKAMFAVAKIVRPTVGCKLNVAFKVKREPVGVTFPYVEHEHSIND